MGPNSYELGGTVVIAVSLEKQSDICRLLSSEIGPPQVGQIQLTPQVVVGLDGQVSHEPDRIFGNTGGMTGQTFIVPDGSGHWCSFDPSSLQPGSQTVVKLGLCCSHFKATVFFEWLLMPICHFVLAQAGYAPIHASGATRPPYSEAPVVFSAWSGVGKTNMVLAALRSGGQYFGDDQVIVRDTGAALPSTRSIAVYGYNRKMVTNLGGQSQIKLRLGSAMHSIARRSRGRSKQVISYLANGLTSVRATSEELGGQPTSPTLVAAHVLCHSIPRGSTLTCTSVAGDSPKSLRDFASAHVAVMEYEYIWFQRYLQTWRWAVKADQDPWTDMTQLWLKNLVGYFDRVPLVLQLGVPLGSSSTIPDESWKAVSLAVRSNRSDRGSKRC